MDFKVLTLNCWGLPIVSKNRKNRIEAIAEVLGTSKFDVVCLQEVWLDSDFKLLREETKTALPFTHYFYSGVTGSGVCILSKHQIQEVFFHQWPVNGYVHKIQHGDWFGGKGVGLCCLKIKNFIINVYSAHLHAEYNRNCDEYRAHRVLQAYDTAQFIKLTSGSCDFVVLAGDLNTEPGDLAYRVLLNVANFKDSYIEMKDECSPKFGTNETLDNSYTPRSLIKKGCIGKRIDYIMYRGGESTNATIQNYLLPLPNRVPKCSYSYSDHEAVAADFLLEKVEQKMEYTKHSEGIAVLKESIEVCNGALSSLRTAAIIYWYIIHIVRGLLTLLLTFTFIMGSLWNRIETHGILSGRLAMEATLMQYEGLTK